MTTNSKQGTPVEQVAMGKIWWVGLLAIALAVLVNFLVRSVALVVLNVDPGFVPLASPSFLPLTIFGSLAAVLVYALVGWLAKRRPITTYRIVSVIALLLSFVPDLALFSGTPGANAGTVGTLMLMHVLTAVIVVGMLTTLARKQ